MSEKIIAYKAMDKNMQCRSKQYEVGKTYHEDKADCCTAGMHACEMPFDVLEKEIDNKQKANKAVKEASESLIEEYKKEAVAEPKKKGIIKRTIHWLKSLFKK